MPDGGRIKISGQNVEIPHYNIMKLQSGRYLKLAFEDNGPGIPESSLSKIFDPYFTTKPTGSGLGLATSYSIVHKHDGLLRVDSEFGKGTTIYWNS